MPSETELVTPVPRFDPKPNNDIDLIVSQTQTDLATPIPTRGQLRSKLPHNQSKNHFDVGGKDIQPLTSGSFETENIDDVNSMYGDERGVNFPLNKTIKIPTLSFD